MLQTTASRAGTRPQRRRNKLPKNSPLQSRYRHSHRCQSPASHNLWVISEWLGFRHWVVASSSGW